jgi:hypothetical protein
MTRWIALGSAVLMVSAAPHAEQGPAVPAAPKAVLVDGARRFQRIDGFGVNVTPAQWRGGNLRKAFDLLVDDLGVTLVRFDAYGKADWLDPARRREGRFDADHLRDVYTRQDFRDAWEAFRYLNGKGIRPFWSVSGRIPAAWAGADGQTLTDYDAYAEMVASQLRWARLEEHLEFSLLSPFNETDLGFPEGPRLGRDAIVPATAAIVAALDRAGLSDVKLIVADEANLSAGYLDALLGEPSLAPRVAAIGTHWYGDGNEGDAEPWYDATRPFARAASSIAANPAWAGRPLWITEYGDLDQSEEVEYGVAWRSTRRLLKLLSDGAAAAMAWDAYDNYHEHDAAWATYGLLRTDRETWTYTPKPRYFAAKQVYRYVPPGFVRIGVTDTGRNPGDVFDKWKAPLRHVRLQAFASTDGRELTIVGMSAVERAVTLDVRLEHLSVPEGTAFRYVRTSADEQARIAGTLRVAGGRLSIPVTAGTIFTVTTLAPDQAPPAR